jgi:hypothetical protein
MNNTLDKPAWYKVDIAKQTELYNTYKRGGYLPCEPSEGDYSRARYLFRFSSQYTENAVLDTVGINSQGISFIPAMQRTQYDQ